MKRLITVSAAIALTAACTGQAAGRTELASSAPRSSSAATPAASATATPAVVPVSGNSAAAPAIESRAAAPAYREVTLPAGTVLPVDLETSVGSDISRVEQPVHGRLRRAIIEHGVEVLPAGAAISGHVTAAERPGKVKGRGYVAFRFTQLDTPGAGTSRISTALISRTAPATKKQDAMKVGAPAAAGAAIGAIVGGGDGAAKGAVIGGAAGTGYVLSTRGKDVRLGKGADLAVKLTAPLTVRIRSY
jgi:hypothetical protein